MADRFVYVRAFLPHLFRRSKIAQKLWKEERNPPSGIAPISPAEAVASIATDKQDQKPAVVAERPEHDPEMRGFRHGLVVE